MKRQLQFVFTIAFILGSFSISAQYGNIVFQDDFEGNGKNWKPFVVNESKGTFKNRDGRFQVDLFRGDIFGAYYGQTTFSGHFEVEIDFEETHGVALGLIQAVDGKPSSYDYSILKVIKNKDGVFEVQLTDYQNGHKDVLDNTLKAKRTRYTQLLNGEVYSVPFSKTAGKLRILRHENEQFLHFYYAVEKEFNGKVYTDWMELAPSKEWGNSKDYYIGLFSVNGTVNFNTVCVRQLPKTEKKDVAPAFTISERPFTWSGYTDSALVVNFGKAFPFAKEGHKFIFWTLNNNVPTWYINNATLFSHGFLETWNGGNPGCHEPMSDRLLAFSDVKVVEDNTVRKVIKWTYQLVDPHYKHPDFGKGTQLPEATEYYTIYADGTIIRKAQYAPKLDTEFRNWHELMELILIAGENHRPKDLLEYPSLSFYESGKAPVHYDNDGSVKWRNNNKRLGATTAVAHVKNAPDLFYAFSDDESIPDTYTHYPLNYELTWHRRTNNFGHWPVTKEPYAQPFKSGSSWSEQIAHTSLIGMGIDQGQDWKSNYLQRPDGRKYRQWLCLMGMNAENGADSAAEKTNSWLFKGEVSMLHPSSSYNRYSYDDKYFEFTNKATSLKCHFKISPKNGLIHPVFKINGWGHHPVQIKINDNVLASSDFITSVDDAGNLLLLLLKTYKGAIEVQVTPTL